MWTIKHVCLLLVVMGATATDISKENKKTELNIVSLENQERLDFLPALYNLISTSNDNNETKHDIGSLEKQEKSVNNLSGTHYDDSSFSNYTQRYDSFGRINSSIEEIKPNTPKDNVKDVFDSTKEFPISTQSKYEDATEHSVSLFDKFLGLSEIKNNTILQDKSVITKSSIKYFSYSSFKTEEIPLKSTEELTQLIFTDAFKDMEIVNNEFDKFIEILIKKNKTQRATRSSDTNSNTTTKSSSFVRPSFNNKITQLETGINKMMKDVEQLKKILNLNNEDKKRLSTLEDATKNLQNFMDNHKKQFEEKITKFESTIESLFNILSGLKDEFIFFKKKVPEQKSEENQTSLLSKCIEDIQSRNFKAAEEKLKFVNDDYKTNFVVKKVYDNQASNIDLILDFGNNIKNITRSFLIYKALNYEMESNGHVNPFKNIELIESLQKNQLNYSIAIQNETESLVKSLKTSIKNAAKENIINDIINGNNLANKLVNKLYFFDEKLFNCIIEEVVDDVYGRTDAAKIIKYIASLKYYAQHIQGYIAIFDTMKKKRDLNNNAIFKLAYNVKDAMNMKNYTNVNSEKKTKLINLKRTLPESVKNIVYLVGVCIKNVMHNEYLYDPDNNHLFNKERRYVFTWTPQNWVPTGGNWIIEHEGDNFYIKNTRGELLYAPDNKHVFNSERRYIFTWRSYCQRFPEAKWKIEPDGDNCYIKNIYNEYLYAPDNNHLFNRERRFPFTWIPELEKFPEALWKIESC